MILINYVLEVLFFGWRSLHEIFENSNSPVDIFVDADGGRCGTDEIEDTDLVYVRPGWLYAGADVLREAFTVGWDPGIDELRNACPMVWAGGVTAEGVEELIHVWVWRGLWGDRGEGTLDGCCWNKGVGAGADKDDSNEASDMALVSWRTEGNWGETSIFPKEMTCPSLALASTRY